MKTAMKNLKPECGNWKLRMVLGIVLCALTLLAVGCSTAQLGETTAEGRRRHIRNARINRQERMGDWDRLWLYDEPSRLTDKRIP